MEGGETAMEVWDWTTANERDGKGKEGLGRGKEEGEKVEEFDL
jgi:hypothetical protein